MPFGGETVFWLIFIDKVIRTLILTNVVPCGILAIKYAGIRKLELGLKAVSNNLKLPCRISNWWRETRALHHPVTFAPSLAIVTVSLLLDLVSLRVHVWTCGL